MTTKKTTAKQTTSKTEEEPDYTKTEGFNLLTPLAELSAPQLGRICKIYGDCFNTDDGDVSMDMDKFWDFLEWLFAEFCADEDAMREFMTGPESMGRAQDLAHAYALELLKQMR